jgi:filamentous hemagglutinin family protein
MKSSPQRWIYRAVAWGIASFLFDGMSLTSYAQVSTNISADGTLGTTITPSGNVYNIDGGTIKGTNQFHSFGQFSIGTGDIASFNGPAGIQNILSRVTGGSASEIDGTIHSNISGANLYLINPSGILFGPNAQLDLSGSFHATTANYIGLEDGTDFNAVAAMDGPLLTSAAPASFGFLDGNPAPIQIQTGVFDFDTFFTTGNPGDGYQNILQVPVGQTLSFVGGTVDIGAGSQPQGFVSAPGGRVNLISVASPGEASFESNGSINVDNFTQLGEVNITGNSFVDGKDVVIRSGQLVIEDATIFPSILFLYGKSDLPPDGGSVDIGVSGDMTVTATGGNVLNTPGIQVFNGSPGDLVSGNAPAIRIDAGSVSVSGPSAQIGTARFGPENINSPNSPEITINTQTLSLMDGGSLALLNFYEGAGGTLEINADTTTIANDTDSPIPTGVLVQSFFHPGFPFLFIPVLANGDSGSIELNSNNLIMRGHVVIDSDSFAFGSSGPITVNTSNALLTGPGSISSQSIVAGNSADVTINATGSGQIQMEDGFRVTATTTGSGDAGEISVTAGKSVDMAGTNTRITSTTVQPSDSDPALTYFAGQFDGFFQANFGIPIPDYPALRVALGIEPHIGDVMDVLAALNGYGLTDVADLVPGDAGTISVTAPILNMDGDTRIETSTGWDGNAGAIVANLGFLYMNDGAAIRSTSGTVLPTGELEVGAGNGGSVNLNATDTISVSGRSQTSGNGSTVSTSTFGDGDGGSISITGNNVKISSGGLISADSGGTLSGQELAGTGLAGNISINADNKIDLNDGTISTRAVTADGGNIEITAPEWVYLLNSDITTSVESGFGGGGNITIDPQFAVLNQSNILANAYGGPGGNITIVADNVISSAQSRIDASSALGINGTVNISNPDQNVAEELAVLPENFLDVTGLISDRCGARAGASSLVPVGPGGLAVDPDGYLPSFGTMTNAGYNGTGKSSAISSGKPWWALTADSSALQLAQVTCTR